MVEWFDPFSLRELFRVGLYSLIPHVLTHDPNPTCDIWGWQFFIWPTNLTFGLKGYSNTNCHPYSKRAFGPFALFTVGTMACHTRLRVTSLGPFLFILFFVLGLIISWFSFYYEEEKEISTNWLSVNWIFKSWPTSHFWWNG
jgi:hypothetical protein